MRLQADTADTADQGPAARPRTSRRTRTAALIGVPVLTGAAGVAVLQLRDDPDAPHSTGDSATVTVDTDTITATTAPVTAPAPPPTTSPFTEILPATEPRPIVAPAPEPTTLPVVAPDSTAPTTPDRTTPDTTVPTSTDPVPASPSSPIAPPHDPRGPEAEIRLGRISIPALGVDEPLFHGIRLTTLDKGPGHWPGTALPGEAGNVVVAGHRTGHGGPFRHLDRLTAGDAVVFSTGSGTTEYRDTETMIVQPDALWIVDQTDSATATLFACHPPGSVAERIVVRLALVA